MKDMENKEKQATGAEEAGEETRENETVDAGEETTQGTGKKEKLFTQEEVNSFIQSRLGQMKKQAAKESMAELDQKMKELQEREMRLTVREELGKRGMPAELAEIVSGSSAEDIGAKLDRLNEIYGKKEDKKEAPKGFQVGSSLNEKGQMDALREAFGLNR